jgi:hypothetical protein
MADAWPLRDGGVYLTPAGAKLLHLTLEAAIRAGRHNGKAPGDRLRSLAKVLAGAGVTLQVGQTSHLASWDQAPSASARNRSSAVPGVLTTTQVAAATGLTPHAVRVAIGRGRLAAERGPDGRWVVSREAVTEWRYSGTVA